MSQTCNSGPLMCCSLVPRQVVQRVGPSNGSVSPSLLAKATSPLRPTNSPPPPTSPAATTPLLRGSSGGNANREDMPNGPSAQNKASSHARRHADGKVISDSCRYHTPMSLVVVVLPRLRQPADSTSLLTPPPPPPPSPCPQEAADNETTSAEQTMDQLQFEANQLKLALATRWGLCVCWPTHEDSVHLPLYVCMCVQ